MKKRILYIEDEAFLARIVKETLERKDYEVLYKKDGARIMEHIQTFNPDVCLLDVMLPHVDGFTLGSMIRNVYQKLPIIFLTAKTQTADVLNGFSSGGTDYLRKPFSMEELVVRIENQVRIAGAEANASAATMQDEMTLGSFKFYPGKFELHHKDNVIKLSHRESQVLSMLVQHKNVLLDRRKLLHSVWGDDSFFNSRNLDVYIRKLRDHLSADEKLEIVTLKGKGYQFVVPQK